MQLPVQAQLCQHWKLVFFVFVFYISFMCLPSVNHLVAFFQPADSRHLTPRGGSIHINDQVIFGHQHLETADHISADQRGGDLFHGYKFTIQKTSDLTNGRTGRGFPLCSGSLDSCYQAGNKERIQLWRLGPHHNNLVRKTKNNSSLL